MRIGTGSRVALVLATTFGCCSGHSRASIATPARCEAAFIAREWVHVIELCGYVERPHRAKLGEAYVLRDLSEPESALAILGELAGTEVELDALYFEGYIRVFRGDSAAETERGRKQLEQALARFQTAGRHTDAARATATLSRVLRETSSFDDALAIAKLGVSEAEHSGDPRSRAQAERDLAWVYDHLGMEHEARIHFREAVLLSRPWPEEQARTYLNFGQFVLDLGEPRELENALAFFDDASASVASAVRNGRHSRVAGLEVAIRLNRADALSQLGRLDAAARELDSIQVDDSNRSKVQLVQGYVAARRDDLDAAVRWFDAAGKKGLLEPDYRWRTSLEIARLYRRAGRTDAAVRAFRAAIATIEGVRGTAAAVELRPWVLAHRAVPYHELLELLAEHGRGIEALAVAESLHARSLLDTVLGRRPDHAAHATTEAQALRSFRLERRLVTSTVHPMPGSELLSLIGASEALVFVMAGQTLWRAHVRQGQVVFQRLPASTAEIIDEYQAQANDPSAAERAGAALIPDEVQRGDQPLYIVASGQRLEGIMFAGLRRHVRYLVEDRPIAYLPGLAALHCAPGLWDDRSIFIGDSRGDLPAAAEEVKRYATAARTSPFVGAEATRAAVEDARRASLLYLAVHGSMTSIDGSIVLADGPLAAAEVVELDLHPRLVVLAGCATATSLDEESFGAFPSAFLAAGSRHVIATLRSVVDHEAAQVTQAWYAQASLPSPIHRLAAAQRQLIGKLPVAAWASFGAWGNAECAP